MGSDARLGQQHPQNSDGPFYVVNGECISCGAPEQCSPGLMSHDSTGHCFFARQPATPEETNQAIVSTWASCCGALRYSGSDRQTLMRLAEMGLAEQCDFRLNDEPIPVTRSLVTFNFEDTNAESSPTRSIQIIRKYLRKYLAESLATREGKVHSEYSSGIYGSFAYTWGTTLVTYSVKFDVEPLQQQRRWAVRITRADGGERRAFAISIHDALRKDSRFREITWFTENEWNSGKLSGQALPY